MRRTSVFVTIAFLAGIGIGYFARSAGGIGTHRKTDTHAADLAAIRAEAENAQLLNEVIADSVVFRRPHRVRLAGELLQILEGAIGGELVGRSGGRQWSGRMIQLDGKRAGDEKESK